MKILKMLTEEQQRAAINLFHAVADTPHAVTTDYKDMLNYGVILVTQHGTLADIGDEAARLVRDTLGLKPVNWAQSFHKSWDKVATCSIEQLISEQLLNYFSTYGLESRGLRSLNYVPVEKILTNLDEKPAIEAFTVVHVLSVEELQEKLIDYLKNTKAPHRDAVECVKALLPLAAGIKVDDVKSFEIKIMYCDLYNLVPTEAQDFLRFAVFKATNGTTTTLVKDDETIGVLKLFARTPLAVKMFESADITSLSRSFYRFKPLFLAFKANEQLASVINKIRRLAVRNHQPVSGFTVSNLMNLLVQNRKSDAVEVISKADRRELIKLINFARQEISLQAHVYNIRNGKVFVKAQSDSTPAPGYQKNVTWLHEVCLNRLKELIKTKNPQVSLRYCDTNVWIAVFVYSIPECSWSITATAQLSFSSGLWSVSQMVKTPPFHSGIGGFESPTDHQIITGGAFICYRYIQLSIYLPWLRKGCQE